MYNVVLHITQSLNVLNLHLTSAPIVKDTRDFSEWRRHLIVSKSLGFEFWPKYYYSGIQIYICVPFKRTRIFSKIAILSATDDNFRPWIVFISISVINKQPSKQNIYVVYSSACSFHSHIFDSITALCAAPCVFKGYLTPKYVASGNNPLFWTTWVEFINTGLLSVACD